jgi:hypothetical protein
MPKSVLRKAIDHMRDFLKALCFVGLLFAIVLGVLKWAPLPFAFIEDIKQTPVLKDTVFPILDTAARGTRGVGRMGIDAVPKLKEQQWLLQLFSEAGSEPLANPANPTPSGGRAPAVDKGANPAAAAAKPSPGFNTAEGAGASQSVKNIVTELLGANFEVLSQSRVVSTALSPVELNFPMNFTVFLKEDSQVIVWAIRGSEELFVVELKSGAIEIKKSPSSSYQVVVALNSGTHKKLKVGEKWIAAARKVDQADVEGLQLGTRAGLDRFFNKLKAPAAPAGSAPPSNAAKAPKPSPAPASVPADEGTPNSGATDGSPVPAGDGAASSSLEDNLQ